MAKLTCFIVTAWDVEYWPFSVGALVKIASFLGRLNWPAEVSDLGNGSIPYVELFILYERWDAVPKYRRQGRPISVSGAPLCLDADIWRLCRYLGGLMRAVRRLTGGLGRFIPGRVGANHGRLRHVGWEKSCHGLTCRPEEREVVLCDLSSLLGHPGGSSAALLGGTFKLKCRTFSCCTQIN